MASRNEVSIETKLKISGVEAVGNLDAGTLKFNVDTAAFKKLVADAGKAADQVKKKLDAIKIKKIPIELNQNSLRTIESQIKNAFKVTKISVQLNQNSLGTLQSQINRVVNLKKLSIELNQNSLRSLESQIRKAVERGINKANIDGLKAKLGSASPAGASNAAAQAVDDVPIPQGSRTINLAQLDEEISKLNQIGVIQNNLSAEQIANAQRVRAAQARKDQERLSRIQELKRELDNLFKKEQRLVSQLSGGGSGRGGRGGGGNIPPGGFGNEIPGGGDRGASSIRDLRSAMDEVGKSTSRARDRLENLDQLAFEVGRKAAAFRGVAIAINSIVNAAQNAAGFIIKFNDSLRELNKILQVGNATLQRVGAELFNLSRQTGVAVDETIGIAEAFARAGLAGRGFGSITQLTERALTGYQGTTLDAKQSTELFIQTLQQVEAGARGLDRALIETTQLFDVLGRAEDITASKATDVQQAFKRSAASIFATGASIDQATAIISVLQERTQRGGEVIGTALKTLASRIANSSSEASQALRGIGVATIDSEGKLRNIFDVLQDTASAFINLSEAEQANIAVKAAGVRQVEIFRAAVQDFNRVQDIQNELANANGDATRKQDEEQKKLATTLNKIGIQLQAIVKKASESPLGQLFVGAIKVGEQFISILNSVDDFLGGSITQFGAAIATFAGVKAIIPLVKGMAKAFQVILITQKETNKSSEMFTNQTQKSSNVVKGQLNTSLEQTANVMKALNQEMLRFEQQTELAAVKAERLAKAQEQARLEISDTQLLSDPSARQRRTQEILNEPQQRVNSNRRAGIRALIGQGRSQELVQAVKTTPSAFSEEERKRILALETKITKQSGKLAGILGKTSRAFGSVLKSAAAAGVGLSIVGGLISSLGNSAREAGSETGGDILGVIGGAAQGAGIGSIFGLPGAAIGAGVGLVKGLFDVFNDGQDPVQRLSSEYTKLGLVLTENGEITSDVAQQLEQALSNIEEFQEFSLKQRQREVDDSRLSNEQRAARREQTQGKIEEAIRSLQSTIVSEQATGGDVTTPVLEALGKVFKEQTGANVDFTSGFLKSLDSDALEEIGADTFNAIREALVSLAPDGNQAFEIEQRINDILTETRDSLPDSATLDQFKAKTKAAFDDFNNNFLDSVFGEDNLFESESPLKRALRDLASGITSEEGQAAIASAQQDAARGVGISSTGLEQLIQRATALGDRARIERNASTLGPEGAALAKILEELPDSIAAANLEANRQIEAENRRARLELQRAAFSSIRGNFIVPLEEAGRLIGTPINKLTVELRSFASAFGQEVVKLREATIRATTPQQKLADTLAMFSQEQLVAAERSQSTREGDSLRQFLANIGSLPGGERAIGRGTGGQILPGFDESTADTTVNQVRQEFANALLGPIQQIKDLQIIDPEEQRSLLESSLGDIGSISALDDESRQKIIEEAQKLGVELIKIETDLATRRADVNKNLVAQLKNTLAEQAKELAANKDRREIIKLNAQAALEELTGIRRLTAERRLEAELSQAVVAETQNRISSLDALIAKEREVLAQDENNVAAQDKLQILQKERTDAAIDLERQLASERIEGIKNTISVAREAISQGREEAEFQRSIISGQAELASLLSIGGSALDDFNARLSQNTQTFRASQAELAAETAIVNATISDESERQARLNDIRKRGVQLALDTARAEAEVISERREAIQQLSQDLAGNQQQQVEAQGAVIDATARLGETYETYLQAIDGAILATTQYNLNLALTANQSRKIVGGFTGIRQEISVLQDTFRDAERLARELGASERTLVTIRRDSINQQLALFNQLLQDQSSLARSFFQSSTSDQADLFLGVQEAQNVAATLGGSFSEFKRLGEDAINSIGSSLLALPQETRQRIISSLETLRSVGGSVGGFTADELLTAIETSALGVSGEGLEVDPLFEVQERIADLNEQQAMIATEQLIAANEQVQAAKEQVEQAEGAKALAEIQLERVKQEGQQIRGQISQLQGGLGTILLQQQDIQRSGFDAVSRGVLRTVDSINVLPDAISVKIAQAFRDVLQTGGVAVGGITGPTSSSTAQSRGSQLAQQQRQQNSNLALLRQRINQSGPAIDNAIIATGERTQRTGNNLPGGGDTERTNSLLSSVLDRLEAIESASTATRDELVELNDSGTTGVAGAAAATPANIPDINVNINGQQTVTVTGFEAGVTAIVSGLEDAFGSLVTDTEARNIANEVVAAIRLQLERLGIIQRNQL